MFNMNQCYNWPIVALIVTPIVAPIVPPIQIKHVHSCVSYQWVTSQKYDQCGCETPSGNRAFSLRPRDPRAWRGLFLLQNCTGRPPYFITPMIKNQGCQQ